MKAFLDKICIGNGQELSTVDASGIWGTADATYFTIDNDYQIKCLEVIGGGNWLAVGTTKTDQTDSKLFLWDGFSTNYNDVITIKENGINSIINSDAIVLVNAGSAGNLYQCTGNSLVPVKTIPFVGSGLTAKVYPGASTNYHGKPLFGVSEGTSTTVKRGVYSWSSADKNYPTVLNLDYTPSHGNLTGTTRQVGALLSEGDTDLYISWKNGSDYGVDLVDGSGVFATAEYQTRIYDADVAHLVKYFSDFLATLARALRTGEKIDVYIDSDRSGSWGSAILTCDYSTDGAILEKSADIQIRAREIQVRIVFTITGSTSPAIDSFLTRFVVEPLY
jgi:hypothetical protein